MSLQPSIENGWILIIYSEEIENDASTLVFAEKTGVSGSKCFIRY